MNRYIFAISLFLDLAFFVVPDSAAIDNPSFETWTGLTNLLTDGGFEASGLPNWPGATLVRSTEQVKYGSNSGKLSRASTVAQMYQNVWSGAGMKGKTYVIGMWVYATNPSNARVEVYDVAQNLYSAYHSGTPGWEYLTVTITVNAAADRLWILGQLDVNSSSAYFDSAICYEIPNLLTDGGMEAWTNSTTLSNWTLSGAGASLNREGITRKNGSYSAKLTRAGSVAILAQQIYLTSGHTYVMSGWVNQSVNGTGVIQLDSVMGVHSPAAGWEFISITFTPTASQVFTAYCTAGLTNGDYYFDSLMIYEMRPPTGWSLSGSGAIIERSDGPIHDGNFAVKLTRNGDDCFVWQIITNIDGHDIAYWKSRTITLGAWVYSTSGNGILVQINDGVTGSNSTVHHNAGWEYLTVTKTMSASATAIHARCFVSNQNATAYFDEVTLTDQWTDTIVATVSLANETLVTVAPTTWNIGAITLGSVTGPTPFTATVGNTATKLEIRGANGMGGWTLGTPAAADRFEVAVTAPALKLTTAYQVLAASVAAYGAQPFALTYKAPTSDTRGGGVDQSFGITVKASAP